MGTSQEKLQFLNMLYVISDKEEIPNEDTCW